MLERSHHAFLRVFEISSLFIAYFGGSAELWFGWVKSLTPSREKKPRRQASYLTQTDSTSS